MMGQNIKNAIGVAAIATALMFGFSVLSYVNTYSKSIEPSTFRSFDVTGEGRVVSIPDVAKFTFSVITEGGTDVANLQKENVEKVNNAIVFIKGSGVEEKDIKTESYSLTPRYQHFSCPQSRNGVVTPCPPSEIVGYTIMQTVSVKARDFDKVGSIVGGVVERGANSTSQLSFELDDPTSAQNEAREEAIAKARAKAEAVAKAGEFKLGRLLSITEGGYYPPVPYYDGYGRGGDFALESKVAAPSIEPGSEDTRVTVTLRYEIE